MDVKKYIYGVPLDRVIEFRQVVLNRKNRISMERMNNDVITVSNGFTAKSEGINLESDESCKVKFKATPTEVVVNIFGEADEKFKNNVLSSWPVKYLCKDFVSRGRFEMDRDLSIIPIFVGPGFTSCKDGKTAEVDPSHFASYESVLILKCIQNEWDEVNSKINRILQLLPLVSETLQQSNLDSYGSTATHKI